MKSIILLTLILLSLGSQSQVPYETLDHFSKEINSVQLPIQNLNYDDGTIDSEMSFPESGLQLYFHNQLASNTVYKKVGEKEYLLVTDNIDFAKAIVVKGMALGGMAGAIRVYFHEEKENIKKTSLTNSKTTNSNLCVADKIIKLKELLNSDPFTKEEFDAAKKQFLNK